MSFDSWQIFALFWAVFVTTPGPNAVNCIDNGMTYGFRRSLWAVLAILCQATLFLTLSALGVAALIATSPQVFSALKLVGAAVLIWLGVRGWMRAAQPLRLRPKSRRSIFTRALAIATINAKSLAGYLAAFTQFVQVDVPIWSQMAAIFPTALGLTTLSYMGYTALGAGLGKTAMGTVMNLWFRRGMATCFVLYGGLLGGTVLSEKVLMS